MSEVDAAVTAARQSWARISGADDAGPAPLARRGGSGRRRLVAIAVTAAAIVAVFVAIGLASPIGILGVALMVALVLGASLGIAVWPAAAPPAPPPPDRLRSVDLKALPAQTGRWLGAQRAALPAPARGLADRIGTRLEVLSPQLGAIDGDSEPALELRRLIGEQLPAFVADYQRVPAPLRGVERNGRSPDRELTEGLSLIEGEIAAMTERLAQRDLDNLATRGRYLEMKYRGDTAD